ncbi:MAG: AAA family ATPase [Patescibacteria group bacterium]
MEKPVGKSFVSLTCPICQGSGQDSGSACKRCSGRGTYAWLEGNTLYWGRTVDSLHLFEEEMERAVKNIINAFLVFFGIIGIIALVVSLIQFTGNDRPWEIFRLQDRLMALFSITVLSDLYAYYRMQRESFLDRAVKQRPFDTLLTEEDPSVLFEQAAAKNKNQMVEVATTYTVPANRAVGQAWQLAKRLGHGTTEPVHLLATLISYPQTGEVLARLGVDGKALVDKLTRSVSRFPRARQSGAVFSAGLLTVLLAAYAEAYIGRQERVDIQHLLVAIINYDEVSRDIFYDLEVEQGQIINAVEWLNIKVRLSEGYHRWRSKAAYKSKGVMNRAMTSQATPLLDRFSHDLTSLARQGVLAPCIGRDREIESVLRIMEGGKNVILTGFPGVGKTSIIEGIAALMAAEDVPDMLQDHRLISLSVASLVGAAGRQGELEGLIMQLINEIVRSGNIVLYIDNIQNMVGVSTEGAQNLDIADIMANALSKRLFYAIATTSPLDYRRYIEPSGSLNSVFQKVEVAEPDVNGTILILEGKSGSVEAKNQIFFSYESIERIVTLADRFIHDRFQPEKSLSILDEVAVYVHRKKGKNAIVTGEDVAEIVITKITEKETEKLLNLEERIHERMVDQEEAVTAVSTALRRARAELRDIRRPIVNLLFLGPTGVGKTELAKTVAEVYFGSEKNMIRLDMSEYQEKSSLARMIGAPPGYSGASEGGYLTEAIRRQPFSLLLLDEIEKAHPDILNIFLQVMDDGRLTDTLGRTIDFTNVILIATSNAGTSMIQKRIQEGRPLAAIKDELMNEELKPYFRPEFLNRFDNIVVFKPLSFDDIIKIVGLMLNQVNKRLAAKGIRLQATDEAKRELAQQGFDPIFGARPLRRAIQDTVDNALANYLLEGKLGRRDVAVLEVGGKISVRPAPPI